MRIRYHEAAEAELLAELLAPGVRELPLRKFPFSLLDSTEGNQIIILAVASHRRRPGYRIERAR